MKRAATMLAAGLFAAGAAYGADMTVAGATIGQRFAYPHCEKDRLGLVIATLKTCFQQGVELAPGWYSANIVYAVNDRPRIINGFGQLFVRDGNVVAAEFRTSGIQTAAADLADLTTKYGPPTSTTDLGRVQNRLGASFQQTMTTWQLPGLSVAYTPIAESLDAGLVTVTTPEGVPLLKARSVALDKLLNPRRL